MGIIKCVNWGPLIDCRLFVIVVVVVVVVVAVVVVYLQGSLGSGIVTSGSHIGFPA